MLCTKKEQIHLGNKPTKVYKYTKLTSKQERKYANEQTVKKKLISKRI